MLTFQPTKSQKKLLGILGAFLLSYLLYSLMIAPVYKAYRAIKLESAQLDVEINELVQNIDRFYRLKSEFFKNEKQLKIVIANLSMDVAELMSLLTSNSPVNNFISSSLEGDKKKIQTNGVTQYPFEISYRATYQQLGAYLQYQEAAMPITYVIEIEIKKVSEETDVVETKLKGAIYNID